MLNKIYRWCEECIVYYENGWYHNGIVDDEGEQRMKWEFALGFQSAAAAAVLGVCRPSLK